MPLTDTRIRNAKPKPRPYKLSDGGGMYLLVTPDGARYWRMDYRFAGKRRTLALGVYPDLSLSDARARREEARRSLAQDIDPGVAKKARKRAAKFASENTFEAIAREWIANRGNGCSPGYCALLTRRGLRRISSLTSDRALLLTIDAPGLVGGVSGRLRERGAIETGHAASAGLRPSIPICHRDRAGKA